MAKQPVEQENPFRKTEPEPRPGAERFDLDKGPTVATGLGIRTGENEALLAIAHELGISKNQLARFAIRYVLQEYLAGRLDLRKWVETPPEPKKNMRMP